MGAGGGCSGAARRQFANGIGWVRVEVRDGLRADCGNCFGLCCVALAFTRSADFAADKQPGEPCGHLGGDDRCGIHRELRGSGYAGCTVYDCFGAGQKVSRLTFAGQDWRAAPDGGRAMFAVLPVVRQLHELLWYLGETLALPQAASLHRAARREADRITALTLAGADDLLALDAAAERARVNELLLRASALVRPGGRSRRHADLVGAKLRGADLRRADLRGAYLIAADLRDADLREADLIGADLRDADVRGADLGTALFLTQAQINASGGDAATRIPPSLARPPHW